ncbi:hypothetical protein [Nostoc sp.]
MTYTTTTKHWENRLSKPTLLAMEKIEEMLEEMGDQGEDLLSKYLPN